MKRSLSLCLMFLLGIALWSSGPASHQAKALTLVGLQAPGDSSKVVTATPTFQWSVQGPGTEIPRKFQIELATDINFGTIIWDDTSSEGTARNKVYDGDIPLVEWTAYYWRMRVQVDSVRTAQGDTINYWQEDFSLTFTFFHTTATRLKIPENLSTIQQGIIWAAQNDTVFVDPGTYYENLRFYKKGVLVTSKYLEDADTAWINRTIIDGSELTRGEKKGSVVYFSSAVDSSSTLMGFTIRGGTGTELDIGAEKRTSGGGIVCDVGSSPTIAYNVITGNQAKHDGGGIFINSAAPNILYNIITDNYTVQGSGGGIESRFSIQVSASPRLNGQQGDSRDTSSPFGSSSQTTEEEVENALSPRDATEISPVNAPPSLGKAAQNNPPVAVISWHARRNGVIERDKYLPGDTLIFDGSASYDPDEGDEIQDYWWSRGSHQDCRQNPPGFANNQTAVDTMVIDETNGGMVRAFLRVYDLSWSEARSETLVINTQYHPIADAGDRAVTGIGEADTAWLDGSESCDINPGDPLSYHWTQLSGPVTVTIGNVDSPLAYFVAQDESYAGTYEFQLKVSDPLSADSATVEAAATRPPVPVCEDDPVFGDTLVGFTPADVMTLDACGSYDPDPGDEVVRYRWREAGRWILNPDGWTEVPFDVAINETQCSQTFFYPFGGLLKFYLRVEDNFGLLSDDSCVVLYSVQIPAKAYAGEDTVLRTGGRAYLNGTAYETNPDQRTGLKYNWRVVSSPTPINILPSDTVKSINFTVGRAGVYNLELIVDDRFALSNPDQIRVIANTPPDANTVNVPHAFEGSEVLLDASASADPDSETFGGPLIFSWTARTPPPGAEPPVILDADQAVARFVPYGTGTYTFRVEVHDTLSDVQPLDSSATGNVAFLTVNVDSTYAYPIIKGNLIARNYSASRGGGLDCNNSSPDVFDNVFYKNHSKLAGGGICARAFSTPQIKRNIFFGNISSDSTGGAIADLKGELAPSATRGFRKYAAIVDNDFWANRGGAMYQTSGIISGNIHDFPRLVDPEFGNFTLECSSPCEALDIGRLVFFRPCSTMERLGMISLSMFQNPVATAAAHFVINTDAPLKTEPVAYVKVGDNAPSPVYFAPISPKSFRGSFVFTASGDAEVSVFASSVLERDTSTAEAFSVQLIGAGKPGTLVSTDRMLKVTFPEGSAEDDIYVTCMSVSGDTRYQFEGDPELEALGAPYQIGPSISFATAPTVRFRLDGLDLEEKDKTLFSVYRYGDGKWSRLESFLEDNSVCAEVKNLGVYRLVYDPAGKHISGRPTAFQLYQNYPNPFNPETQLKYDLPVAGHVNLVVYNVLGQMVRTLVDEFQDVGRKSVIWDSRDDDGRELASGIYFYRLKADSFQKTMKMVLIK